MKNFKSGLSKNCKDHKEKLPGKLK